jgi:hypothetical protein
MVLKVKRINENFVTRNYPELIRAVGKIPDLNERQRELVYGLCIDVAEQSDGNVGVFYTEFGDEIEMEEEL